jgi:putative hydrolase of the HAD superfamily
MPCPIRLVLFDMDDVLCAYDWPGRVAELARLSGRPSDSVAQAIWHSGFEDAADAGHIDADAYMAGFAERLGMPFTQAEWTANRRGSMTPWPDMLTLAARIGQQARIGILTNNGHLTGAVLDQLFPELRPIFGDDILTSAAMGVQKPEPEIFRRALARFGVAPHEALFTDDRPENVEGAIAAGLHGHVHAGADALRERLAALGLVLA